MATRASLFLERFDRDRPVFLRAAMLARQLVDAPFERLAETEIDAVQRQDTAPLDHLEQPIGERDLDFRHLAGAGLPHDPPFVDEAEPFGDFLAIGLDVRGDPRPRQALERAPQSVIAVAIEEHPSELQSLMRTSYAV